MILTNILEIEQRFSQSHLFTETQASLVIDKAIILEVLILLKEKYHYHFLLDIVGIDYSEHSEYQSHNIKSRWGLVYILKNFESNHIVRIECQDHLLSSWPSLRGIWEQAHWYEREAFDMFGFEFEGQNYTRLLCHQEMTGHPLLKDFAFDNFLKVEQIKQDPWSEGSEDEESSIVIGPQHFVTRGGGRIQFNLKNDRILSGQVEIGFQHRSLEKIAEKCTLSALFPIFERLNYQAPAFGSCALAYTLEDALSLEVSDKVKALRMLLMELSRIQDHLIGFSSLFKVCDLRVYDEICLTLLRQIFELYREWGGNEYFPNLICLGGVSKDLPKTWPWKCSQFLANLKDRLRYIELGLNKKSLWHERLRVCPYRAKTALQSGWTGPNLRSCGVNYDMRKAKEFYFYSELDFEVPLGINGDCLDRYLVRFFEIFESIKIIHQVLDGIPAGELKRDYRPDFPKTSIFHSFETSSGLLGLSLILDEGDRPYRLKVRSPSFAHMQSFEKLVTDASIDDAFCALASLNCCPGEVDR